MPKTRSGSRRAKKRPHNWPRTIEKLNRSTGGELRIKMGSPGSAQVTRCRLLEQWSNLDAETVGPTLVLRLKQLSDPNEHVVLLHGLGRTPRSMRPLALRLEDAGYRVHNLGYASTRSEPAALVDWLRRQVAGRCGSAQRLHFVGHSLGGIIARAFLAQERPAGLGRVVLLAPPNRGSEYVDWIGDWPLFGALLGPTARALGTDARSLPNRIPAPDYEMGVIAGTGSLNPVSDALFEGDHDGTVRVENTRLPGLRDFLTLPTSHTFIMRSPEVARQVLCFLREGRFADPG